MWLGYRVFMSADMKHKIYYVLVHMYTFKIKVWSFKTFYNQITSKLIEISRFTVYKTPHPLQEKLLKKKWENLLNVNVHAVRPFM